MDKALLRFVPHVLSIPDVLLRQALIYKSSAWLRSQPKQVVRWYLDFLVQERRRMLGTALHPTTRQPLPALQFPTPQLAKSYRLTLTRCYCRIRATCR